MLYTGFLLGLLSGFHCVGMCGPIALILPVSKSNSFKKHLQVFLYHLGRICTYSLLGGLFGLVGKGLFLSDFQQYLSISIGVLMIVLVVFPKISKQITHKASPFAFFLNSVKLKLGLYLKKESLYASFLIGFFNGFLPCGMVYMALVGAVAIPEMYGSVLFMVLFGLGTIPLLSILIYVKDAFSVNFRNKIQKAIPVFVIAIGVLFILRGLGLGIPYVSPLDNTLFLSSEPKLCH